ncbi:MAG: hypothetical protein OEZ29_05975 [Candidatus Bathyarchaeota archaeon]|nr:hypothetical protein [Candidatus Bathyarchaeota archaeon]MDH5780125.1 hypothetical protein [Candidatus Bathyarchaeota archaeon]
MDRKTLILIAIAAALVALISSMSVWHFYRYETTILSLTYQANPIISSPLSGVNYTWEAKVYSTRVFGNSPFNGKGYVHRERITSENRFANHPEIKQSNISLRLRFLITNETGHVICNKTFQIADGSDRQFTFEFKPELAKAGNTLQISVSLNLNVAYKYGDGGEHKELKQQKEWTKTIQVQLAEPRTGTVF